MIVVVAMRVLARAIVDMPFWWDDWMSFVSMVSKTLLHIHELRVVSTVL